MGRTVFADERLYAYLKTFDKGNLLTIGLILGQSHAGKDYVIHMTKTSISPPDTEKYLILKLRSLGEINDLWVADHAKQATRMLPGGMYILGIFIVTEDDILTPFPQKIKSILTHLHKYLSTNYLFGNSDHNEKIVLNYRSKAKRFSAKSFDIVTSSVNSVEFKFIEKPIKFIKLECKYELDLLHHLGDDYGLDLKRNITVLLKDVYHNLKFSVFLYDGELKDSDENLDCLGKKKKRSGKLAHSGSPDEQKSIEVSILQSCDDIISGSEFVLKHTDNQIRIVGHIASSVWLHPTVCFKNASTAIVQDIMRSLSTRLEMHWDSLIEEEHKDDINSIHEPPRRVLVPLPNSKITISDYLFPGEGADEAKTSVEEILDIKLADGSHEIEDVEGSVDISEYYATSATSLNEEKILSNDKEHSKMMFIIGSVFALVVLIISIIVHVVVGW